MIENSILYNWKYIPIKVKKKFVPKLLSTFWLSAKSRIIPTLIYLVCTHAQSAQCYSLSWEEGENAWSGDNVCQRPTNHINNKTFMTVEHDAYVTSRNFNFNCKAIISCCCCCCFFNNFWWRCSGCLQSVSVLGFLISCAFVSVWCQWRRGDQEAIAAVVALAAINNTWILQNKSLRNA